MPERPRPIPSGLATLALQMPRLPPCTVPTGRGKLLLEKLPLPACPKVLDPTTPELCNKIAEIELKVGKLFHELELVVAYTDAVELLNEEADINEDRR